MDLIELGKKNKKRYISEYNNFIKIFGVNLKYYWNMFWGFDIIKFDELLETPDGVSTKDFVKKKYGIEGCECIERLIKV